MGLEQFANNPKGTVITLGSGYTAGGTTISVSSTAVFPASAPYRIVVDPNTSNAEIMLVTGISGTTLTVTTAYEGTTNVNHSSGAVVAHVDTAGLTQKISNVTAAPISVLDPAYGAIPDCRRLTDITATSGSASITSGGLASFTAADTGKIINLYDFANSNYVFRGTFTYVSPTTGTLSGNAGNNLSAGNCIGYIGTDNTAAFNAALVQASTNLSPTSQGANLALGGGLGAVDFPTISVGNMYAFSGQIVVPTNVVLNGDAMLVTMVGPASTNSQGNANRVFPFILMPGASIDFLQMFCNYTMGICMGTYSQQSHSFIHDFTQWDLGPNNSSGSIATTANVNSGGSGYVVNEVITLTGGTFTTAAQVTVLSVSAGAITAAYVSRGGVYSVTASNPVAQGSTTGSGTGANFNISFATNSHIGIELSGNDTYIGRHWSKNANIGLSLDQANDVMIDHLFEIGCGTAIQCKGCEEVQIGITQLDTGSFAGVTVDSTHTFRMVSLNAFSINTTGLTYAVGIGQNDGSNPVNNADITMSAYRSGGNVLQIGNCADSVFRANVTNAALFGAGGVAISFAVVFTGAATPTGNILIDVSLGTIGSTITAKSGTGYGMFRLNGNPYSSIATPTNGQTVTMDSATPTLILNPSGTLATLTVNLPANPMDNMVVRIGTDQTITSLTVSGNGHTLKNTISTLAAGGGAAWSYNKAASTYYRLQ